ncbi:MAG: hypothetical protein E6I10_05620 [Chloroflexi bacterium]|nr:MAG: hypothetical protein E6I10_05620 [Chloroflexota bacterium]
MHRLQRLALGITLSVVVAGCGSPKATSTPSATGTPTPTPTSAASPAAVHGGYAVLIGGASGDSYTLRTVDSSGKTVATVNAANRSRIRAGGAPAIVMPLVSASATHLYYINGNSEVRSLSVDGKTTLTTHLPGTATVQAGFAVSPDDTRIAVSTIDYAAHPAALRLYVENLVGGGNHVEIFSSSSSYVWPVGWEGTGLILASGPAAAQYGAGNPYDAINGYHVVDATTADRRSAICEPPSQAIGLIANTGALCAADAGTFVQSWDGARHALPADCRALSPTGTMAACGGAGPGVSTGAISVVSLDGSRTSTGVAGFGPIGWIDDDHLIFAAGANVSSDLELLDRRSGVATPLGHDLDLVARFGG